ncbi:2-hydroxychromene-2-carboxylate isomerase [Terasakiella sp. SH-1]|uniref:2-hydroxychromene-2-carboxylate isomerase n=1 Tax=Terasakiella sp. SH-1 TaxID=2560057 RepID=UPI00107483C4|nr:2-hydroxychromene-2-carboxylate isomerase [Terasakiella sp. SH-1]
MANPIEFYFEFGSPYGYFSAQEIDAIGQEFGREVVWKPFMLGSAFKATQSMPLMNVPLKGPYCVHDWERMSAYTGTAWKLPEKFPAAILAAPRGFYWLKDQGQDELAVTFAKAAYKAYFAEGRPLWELEATADIAAECGIERDEFLQAVQTPEVKARLIEEGQKAIESGVFGSPFIRVDGEDFWGWDRLAMVRDWLKNGKWG